MANNQPAQTQHPVGSSLEALESTEGFVVVSLETAALPLMIQMV